MRQLVSVLLLLLASALAQLPGGIQMGGSHGQSRVVDPGGRVLEQARVFGQQLLIHDLDLGLCVPQKRKMPMAGVNSKLFGAMWAEGLKAVGSRMKIDW